MKDLCRRFSGKEVSVPVILVDLVGINQFKIVNGKESDFESILDCPACLAGKKNSFEVNLKGGDRVRTNPKIQSNATCVVLRLDSLVFF